MVFFPARVKEGNRQNACCLWDMADEARRPSCAHKNARILCDAPRSIMVFVCGYVTAAFCDYAIVRGELPDLSFNTDGADGQVTKNTTFRHKKALTSAFANERADLFVSC
jgi:hypothetical protein